MRDALGKTVVVLIDDVVPAGTHRVTWDVERGTPSGVYFYTLESSSSAVTRSVVLMK